MSRIGLGVYPNHRCFDPDRPAWLPYWFDTFGEEACTVGMYPGGRNTPPSPPAGPPPTAPQTPGQMVDPGAWTPGDSTPGPGDWIDRVRWVLDGYDPRADDSTSPISVLWLAVGAVAVIWAGVTVAGAASASGARDVFRWPKKKGRRR